MKDDKCVVGDICAFGRNQKNYWLNIPQKKELKFDKRTENSGGSLEKKPKPFKGKSEIVSTNSAQTLATKLHKG